MKRAPRLTDKELEAIGNGLDRALAELEAIIDDDPDYAAQFDAVTAANEKVALILAYRRQRKT